MDRQEYVDDIVAHCEPDRACLITAEGKIGWLYSEGAVKKALELWREGALDKNVFATHTQKGDPFKIRHPVRMGLVPHRDGNVGVFEFDFDAHEGQEDHTPLAGNLERWLGVEAVQFQSKSGRGLHLVYRLNPPVKIEEFRSWSRSWGFNRQSRIECFPKSDKLTQVWLPNESDPATGSDAYVSGEFCTATLTSLPASPPTELTNRGLDFLMGFCPPGCRNVELNLASHEFGQKGVDRRTATDLCARGAKLCGHDGDFDMILPKFWTGG